MEEGVLSHQSQLTFFNNVHFIKNSAAYGGGIHAFIGNMTFHGKSKFMENVAMNGGALSLAGNSKFYFVPKATFFFYQNIATQHGEAIYV